MKRILFVLFIVFSVNSILQSLTVNEKIKQELNSLYDLKDGSIKVRTIDTILKNGGIIDNIESKDRPSKGPKVIGVLDAWEHIGEVKTVKGVIRYIANNGREVCIGFKKPHQGNFAILILKEHWRNFRKIPDKLYKVGQEIRVTGKIVWYQGDPVVYVQKPSQIK